jgi:hypothetical protein
VIEPGLEENRIMVLRPKDYIDMGGENIRLDAASALVSQRTSVYPWSMTQSTKSKTD